MNYINEETLVRIPSGSILTKEQMDTVYKFANGLNVKLSYEKIAQKLWTYILIIDDEKGSTYEELADVIGLTDDELALCRRLEREE